MNVHAEQPRLSAAQLQRWQGLPLCWVDAMPRVDTRDITFPRPVLALLETGVAQAEFSFRDRSEQLDIRAGTMGLFVSELQRRSRWQTRGARRIMLELDAAWLSARSLGDLDWWPTLRQDTAFRDDEIAAVLRAATVEIAAGCPHGRLYAESLSFGIAMRVAQRQTSRAPGGAERGRLTSAQWQRVVDLVQAELAGSLSLADMARAAGYSPPHFARLMRNTVGTTPHRYVQSVRIERACALLREGDLPLAEVAAVTGFASQSHMTTALGLVVGCTPGDLRRSARARSG